MNFQKVICRDSKTSSSLSFQLDEDFHGYELLLLRKLQTDPRTYIEWKRKLKKNATDENYTFGAIPHSLWYLAVTLDRKKDRFIRFLTQEVDKNQQHEHFFSKDTLLLKYLNCHMFTELHLDGIFKYGDDNTLPKEIFRCPSVRLLSLKYNYLDKLPPDIGRMGNLEYLALTNNKLQNKSLPYTLTFCTRLKTLFLDNNLLDALPGFLLKMTSLETVHRHGNHNYFKSTFMWYHTDVNERILPIFGTRDFPPRQPDSLQFWAARAAISSKTNFYANSGVAPALKDYISNVCSLFYICGYCGTAKLSSQPGYKVITFKNPYLGNTCVPFQHMACSVLCAREIEIPSRREQISAASRLDKEYEHYVIECQKHYCTSAAFCTKNALMSSFRRTKRRPVGEPECDIDGEESSGMSCEGKSRQSGRGSPRDRRRSRALSNHNACNLL